TRSGTVQSAAEPCALSNGSPRLNSSFAHHRNQTGALHESQSTASALARALARTQIPCLNWPGLVRYRSLHLPHDPSVRRFPTQFIHPSGSSYPLQRVHALTKHIRPHSKYIGFPVGGFLQVAVSEAPSQSACKLELLRAGAPDTALRLALRLFGTYSQNDTLRFYTSSCICRSHRHVNSIQIRTSARHVRPAHSSCRRARADSRLCDCAGLTCLAEVRIW